MSAADQGPLQSYIETFVHHVRTQKQLSPRTCDSYLRDLQVLNHYCHQHNISQINHILPQDIRHCLGLRYRQGLSGKSLQRWLSAVRQFFIFGGQHFQLQSNPAAGIRAPKAEKPLPKTLDVDQAGQYVELTGDDPLTLRDRAMLELMYSSGLRLAEMVGLNVSAIELSNRQLTVLGKGNKWRTLPIGSQALTALQQWLTVRQQLLKNDAEPALFISKLGTRISHRNVQKRFAEHAQAQGIDKPVNPHMLRHSFASHMLESSGDLRAVQELLGHANIATTQIYTHLDFQHLASVYDKAHPRAQKRSDNDD